MLNSCVPCSCNFEISGTDFSLKKHSNQRGGLVDTVLRVRSASIVKMVNIGHRQERRRVCNCGLVGQCM